MDDERVVRSETQTIDLSLRVCEHELSAALADLAGVDRAAPGVPESIARYAQALMERLELFPECPHKRDR